MANLFIGELVRLAKIGTIIEGKLGINCTCGECKTQQKYIVLWEDGTQSQWLHSYELEPCLGIVELHKLRDIIIAKLRSGDLDEEFVQSEFDKIEQLTQT